MINRAHANTHATPNIAALDEQNLALANQTLAEWQLARLKTLNRLVGFSQIFNLQFLPFSNNFE